MRVAVVFSLAVIAACGSSDGDSAAPLPDGGAGDAVAASDGGAGVTDARAADGATTTSDEAGNAALVSPAMNFCGPAASCNGTAWRLHPPR